MEEYNGFYNQLNTSQKLEDIYKRFSTYREELTEIVIDLISKSFDKKVHVVVFGAGNLMDFDYRQLDDLSTCKSIQITDVDNEAMRNGLDYLQLNKSKIEVVNFNYLGDFVDGHLNLLINQLNLPYISKKESLDKVEEFFVNILNEFEQYSYLDYIHIKGDVVIVMPIYTQLLYLELIDKLQNTKGYKHIQEYLLQKMIYVIDEFNKKVIKCVRAEGVLILLSDIIEESIVADKEPDSRDEIKDKIETYEKTYGIGLGSFGLLNCCDYMVPLEEYYLNWEFNETRRFLVKGLKLKHLNNQ